MSASTVSWQHVIVAREGPITIVTLNRPGVLNALHRAAHEELAAIFDEFAADPDQWVAIITGQGQRAFCAGQDLKFQAAGETLAWPASGFGGLTSRFDLNKPLIAAVNGVALGGGFEIAMACDIVIAAEHAQFGLPEPKVGLAALAGGLHRLPRAIGLSRAMAVILTCRRVSALEGRELGFVHRVVPAEHLMDAARNLAGQICEASPVAIRASKEAALRALDCELPAAIANQFELPAVRTMQQSEDMQEGPKAFAEKRSPRWRGR